MPNLLQNCANLLEWINETNETNLEVFEECCVRFVVNSLSDNKINSISKHLGISENILRESILSVIRLALNQIHLKKKGSSAIESTISYSKIVKERRSFLLKLIESLTNRPECEELLKNILERETKGSYRDSVWRMDIDIAQRSIENADPTVTFVCNLRTADGEQTLNLSPAMLMKLEKELQFAVNAMNKTKSTRI